MKAANYKASLQLKIFSVSHEPPPPNVGAVPPFNLLGDGFDPLGRPV